LATQPIQTHIYLHGRIYMGSGLCGHQNYAFLNNERENPPVLYTNPTNFFVTCQSSWHTKKHSRPATQATHTFSFDTKRRLSGTKATSTPWVGLTMEGTFALAKLPPAPAQASHSRTARCSSKGCSTTPLRDECRCQCFWSMVVLSTSPRLASRESCKPWMASKTPIQCRIMPPHFLLEQSCTMVSGYELLFDKN
jgi:hypothetical protein